MLKKYSVILSVLYTIVLTTLSLVKLNIETPNLPEFKDKIIHAIAHFIFVVIWFVVFNFKLKTNYNKAIYCAAIFSLIYGISIELLQGAITLTRQTEVNDVIANVIGMVVAVLFLVCVKKWVLKSNNTLLF